LIFRRNWWTFLNAAGLVIEPSPVVGWIDNRLLTSWRTMSFLMRDSRPLAVERSAACGLPLLG
jgi:hypothetical protein